MDTNLEGALVGVPPSPAAFFVNTVKSEVVKRRKSDMNERRR